MCISNRIGNILSLVVHSSFGHRVTMCIGNRIGNDSTGTYSYGYVLLSALCQGRPVALAGA